MRSLSIATQSTKLVGLPRFTMWYVKGLNHRFKQTTYTKSNWSVNELKANDKDKNKTFP